MNNDGIIYMFGFMLLLGGTGYILGHVHGQGAVCRAIGGDGAQMVEGVCSVPTGQKGWKPVEVK